LKAEKEIVRKEKRKGKANNQTNKTYLCVVAVLVDAENITTLFDDLVLVKNHNVLSIAMHLQHLVDKGMVFDCNRDLGFSVDAFIEQQFGPNVDGRML
jgi:hypothetical protein